MALSLTDTSSGKESRGTSFSSSAAVGTSACPSAISSTCVVSLFEGRENKNRGKQIGAAAMNKESPDIVLFQLADTPIYWNLCSELEVLKPIEIVVPSSVCRDSILMKVLTQFFPSVRIVLVARVHFSDIASLDSMSTFLKSASSEESAAEKPLALAAANALIKYISFVDKVSLVDLRVIWKEHRNLMTMDLHTQRVLELVEQSRRMDRCFLSILNHCSTKMGYRLLKINLLQPPNDSATILSRSDAVQNLVSKPDLLENVQATLSRLDDVELAFSRLSRRSMKKRNAQIAASTLSHLLVIKKLLDSVPLLIDALESFDAVLLQFVRDVLFEASAVDDLRKFLSNSLVHEESAPLSKGSLQKRAQLVFSIRVGINGLLDVARKTYSQTIEEMSSLVDAYQSSYRGCDLKLHFTASHGYVISMNRDPADVGKGFLKIRGCMNGQHWFCTTEALLSLNDRNNEILEEIFLLIYDVIDDILGTVESKLGMFFSISESIALLDMLCSLASYSSFSCGSNSNNSHLRPSSDDALVFCRPEISKEGELRICGGRNPLFGSNRDVVPFDVGLDKQKPFLLGLGCNMSGKSVFLRQIALMVVLACVGSFVPANSMVFPAGIDRLILHAGSESELFSELAVSDLISSFSAEMSHVAAICNTSSRKSLILVDEIGHSTSPTYGIGIFWSFSEFLVSLGCLSVVVTRSVELLGLSSIYDSFSCVQILQSHETVPIHDCETFLQSTTEMRYSAISIARSLGLPDFVCDDAMKLVDESVSKLGEKRALCNLQHARVEIFQDNASVEDDQQEERDEE